MGHVWIERARARHGGGANRVGTVVGGHRPGLKFPQQGRAGGKSGGAQREEARSAKWPLYLVALGLLLLLLMLLLLLWCLLTDVG